MVYTYLNWLISPSHGFQHQIIYFLHWPHLVVLHQRNPDLTVGANPVDEVTEGIEIDGCFADLFLGEGTE